MLVKTRLHERLVVDFAEFSASREFTAATPHPVDLMLTCGSHRMVVEVKVLSRGNAMEAVRAALGQLLTYEYSLYQGATIELVALFSEPIGEAFVAFLKHHGVASLWWEGRWLGSPKAVEYELVDELPFAP